MHESQTRERDIALAWAAGFYDGEGSTGVAEDKRNGRLGIYVSIHQAEKTILRKFARIVRQGRVTGPYASGHADTPIWQYRATGLAALAVLDLIEPYLSQTKRRQARRARTAWEPYRLTHRPRAGNGSRKCYRGHRKSFRNGRLVCLPCERAKAKSWRKNNRERSRQVSRDSRRRRYATDPVYREQQKKSSRDRYQRRSGTDA